jgi:crotonobetainyl-CoA:carnitine CoA-transferase CaiB-like acyl-CoA transferase
LATFEHSRTSAHPPLAGLRVIELARILAGPWAGQLLADLGADVIKVESPAGDDTRQWGPPFIDYADGGRDAAYFHSCNRGKRSVVADFAVPADARFVQALCDGADVVIENFRVGGLARFGLDAASCRARNPRLVYCSITGFGQDGPYAARAGYDFVVQAMGGIMDLTGDPAGEPQKGGVAHTDLFTGLYAVVAIQAALARRAATGEGAHVDLALLDTQVAVLANQALNYLASGQPPRRLGNAHPNLVPYQVFPTAGDPLVIAVGNDAQFRRLCGVLRLPALADDARCADNAARVGHRDWLVGELTAATRTWSRDALLAALEAQGVPAGPINRVDEVFADPQVRHRGLERHLPLPAVAPPLRLEGQVAMSARPAPRLGADTAAVRAELEALHGAGSAGTIPREC